MPYILRQQPYTLSQLSDSGQKTVLETRWLIARIEQLLRASPDTSTGLKMVSFSRRGLRRQVLDYAAKKAEMRGWTWWEDDQRDEVQVLGG